MQKFRFHVVGLPHTVVNKEFLPCAYTQKVLNFCKMMKSLDHEVYLYAGEHSDPTICTEVISVISEAQQQLFFGHTDWKKDFFPIVWDENLPYWKTMNTNTIAEIQKRAQERDILCLIGGTCQKPIADALDMMCVEFGIGYQGIFSPFKVFESYAWMHYIYGLQVGIAPKPEPGKNKTFENGQYFDCVIPNYFDPADFPFGEKKEDYYLYIGRMISRKGAHIAAEVVGKLGGKIKMAGQGAEIKEDGSIVAKEFTLKGDHIEYLGTVGVKERGELMSKAKAVFVPTQYIGPFEGVSIEAGLCGTPVITTDWGCFAENVIDGVTGFRTRTMGEMMWAAEAVDKLDYQKIRDWAIANFSMDRVRYLYQAYFEQLASVWGEGWYETSFDPAYRRYYKYPPQ